MFTHSTETKMPDDISEATLLKDLFQTLQSKYRVKAGVQMTSYMNTVLKRREGADPDSLLYIETEILLLFQLVHSLRVLLQKSPDCKDTRDSLNHNRTQLSNYIDKWIELQE